jgi:hypothetical protein
MSHTNSFYESLCFFRLSVHGIQKQLKSKYIPTLSQLQSSIPGSGAWEPVYVTKHQFIIFNQLCTGEVEKIDDQELLNYLSKEDIEPNEFFQSLPARVKQVVAFAVLCSNFSAQSPHDLRRVI